MMKKFLILTTAVFLFSTAGHQVCGDVPSAGVNSKDLPYTPVVT